MANKYEKSPAQASKFSAEEAEFLKQCVARGMTGSQIARAMNEHNADWPIRSRNSIIGFCHRMKYRLRTSPDAAQRVRTSPDAAQRVRTSPDAAQRVRPLRNVQLSAEERAASSKVELFRKSPRKDTLETLKSIFDEAAPAAPPVKPPNGGVPIFSAPTYGVCRFIVDDTPLNQKICCAPSKARADGTLSSWCADHAAIVFRKVQPGELAAQKGRLKPGEKPSNLMKMWMKNKVSW